MQANRTANEMAKAQLGAKDTKYLSIGYQDEPIELRAPRIG
jgi:hypothetical protein